MGYLEEGEKRTEWDEIERSHSDESCFKGQARE